MAIATARALDAATVSEAFQITVAQRGDAPALRTYGSDEVITWAQYGARVRDLAAALAALGVQRGDTVALLLRNRAEFHLLDVAVMHLGATPFSLYNTASAEQMSYVLGHSGCRVLLTEEAFRAPLRDVAAPATLFIESDLDVAAGSGAGFEPATVSPDDVLTLIYTSGTTGAPKGVELTHANMMASVRASSALIPMQVGGRCVSYLPTAHIADRWIAHYYGSIMFGGELTAVPDGAQIIGALPSIRPTVWLAVPRIWEKLKAALERQGMTDPASAPEAARATVRASLGLDKIELVVSGAAPLGVDVLAYFAALGIEICEGWGMSELAAIGAINPPGATKPGTVGPSVPGLEMTLADDGELLCRGAIVMRGYRNDPERTAEAIDADGWMHTGDVATIDADGYVTIVDRKKEIIVNAAGKNMSPANIELTLTGSGALIGHAVCVGDRRPYNVALIALDVDAVGDAYSRPWSADAALRSAVEHLVDAANARLSRVEQIKRFAILDEPWQPGSDELTPTSKLKRKPIAEKYAAVIDGLYQA